MFTDQMYIQLPDLMLRAGSINPGRRSPLDAITAHVCLRSPTWRIDDILRWRIERRELLMVILQCRHNKQEYGDLSYQNRFDQQQFQRGHGERHDCRLDEERQNEEGQYL